jgi:two-component system alkaline phosphatase synthesis response regulator PhoP
MTPSIMVFDPSSTRSAESVAAAATGGAPDEASEPGYHQGMTGAGSENRPERNRGPAGSGADPRIGPRVAVIDDERSVLEMTATLLTTAGYRPLQFTSAEAALPVLREDPPDLVLVDILLEGMTGIELCREIRRDSRLAQVPVILVTGNRISDADQVLGFDVGADDYVLKPWSAEILLARVAAALRRARKSDVARITHGPLALDPARREALLDGKPLTLTPTEFLILLKLVSHPDRALARADLIDADEIDREVTDRNVDVHVLSIRRKLGMHRSLIETVFRVGYRIAPIIEERT